MTFGTDRSVDTGRHCEKFWAGRRRPTRRARVGVVQPRKLRSSPLPPPGRGLTASGWLVAVGTRTPCGRTLDSSRPAGVEGVPDLVRQRATAAGDVGRRWLRELPGIVDELVERWALSVGEPFSGGTAACVLAVTRSDGSDAVLKVLLPPEVVGVSELAAARAAHELADGQGCAALLDVDETRSALLLERLGPNLHELELALPEVLATIADTLLEFWRPLPADHPFPTGVDKARWLADFIVEEWHRSGEACERAIVDRAVGYCMRRADRFDPGDVVLVHGDAHGWNTLRAGAGFKFVDPEGVASSRAHDLAVPMREYHEPLLAGDTPSLLRARADELAKRCGVDPDEVWEWGYIERVSTGLLNLRDFDDGSGEGFLEVARRCL